MKNIWNKVKKSLRKYRLDMKFDCCPMPHYNSKEFPEYMEWVRGYKLSQQELDELRQKLEGPTISVTESKVDPSEVAVRMLPSIVTALM